MRDMRNAYKNLVRKREGKLQQLGRPRHRREVNIRIN